ncbi:phenylalanine--tRNA ligase subunit beta [Loigolactobacillus zhaoyuanensis]|uniref:phenylalanine--tRNA ligase subunit beta n=1 Tax=Loigolactobacillus zhaoyuanensis TaxID=2486017 RepID=UPI000F74568C|nr:phenylalanine--tRNA ligase subunit beta [Loigolactobacillus zhaoyuanensis]
MKISYKWLKEYVDLDMTPEELANKVTLTGIEVDGVKHPDAGLKKIVVGYVESTKPHPDSDHLQLCQVQISADETVQIVCGAPNVAAGQKVIVALPGSRIANNEKIKKGKLRGEISNGMICALQEIGFSDDVTPQVYADGIYVLPADAEVGQPVYAYLGMDDAILDLEITPNRADALSVRGVAHEVAAIYAQAVHFPKVALTEATKKASAVLQAQVTDVADAPSYNLRVLENVTIKPSPLWLQRRLWNAGVRPINNVVDITNLIMLDYGQPLHAFDYAKIGGQTIEVRRAQADETLTTLDGKERDLTEDDIVITNGADVLNLAGVMGGLDSEITNETTTVILESAVFEPTHIRKTAQRYNLRSEASSRFEKGVNTATVLTALDDAASLMADLADATVLAGRVSPTVLKPADVTVNVSTERINRVLGTTITTAEVKAIFERLGFGVTEAAGIFTVSVPPRRWDIAIEADLIEEVARLYGYDRLPETLTASASTPGLLTERQQLIRHLEATLEANGLSQALSYALTTPDKANAFQLTASQPTSVDWPMTVDHATLRMNLVSGLLDDLAYNAARKQQNVALYEQGRVFLKQHQATVRPHELEYLAGAITGDWQTATWNQPAQPVDFYQLKGLVESTLAEFNLTTTPEFAATARHQDMHPGRTADILVGNQVVGFLGQVHPRVSQQYRLPATYVFQLDLEQLLALEQQTVMYHAVPRYPAITRDIALVVDESVTNAALTATIRENGGSYLSAVQLFDLYAGAHIDTGKKSLAYTLTYQNTAATLTDDQVNEAFAKVVAALQTEHAATIR